MFNRSGRTGNYAYTVSRVKAKKAKLLKEEDYNKMLQMSIPEICRYMGETNYQKEIVDLAGRHEGIDLVEYATYTNMAKVFNSILGSSQGELKTMVSAYLEKWDIWNLKVILRGRSFGLDPDMVREDLVPAGSLDMEDLEKLITLGVDDDLLSAFARMVGIPPQDLVAAYKNTENGLGEVEDFLDKYYYARLLSSINPTTRPGRMFQDFVRMEIDNKNLETIMKLKAEGVYGDVVMKYIIPDGKQVDKRLAQQLANAETIEAMISDASQLDVADILKKLVENEDVLIRDVVHEMKQFEITQAKKFSHMYPLSVVPVIDYMIHKEIEVSNIRTIARGIESGLDKDLIKGLLVI